MTCGDFEDFLHVVSADGVQMLSNKGGRTWLSRHDGQRLSNCNYVPWLRHQNTITIDPIPGSVQIGRILDAGATPAVEALWGGLYGDLARCQ